jgi:uroporphyrinogen decarboxylase
MNTLLLDALQRKNLSRPPVWLMRQAGRYMSDYRALRQKYSFLEMVHTPELAAEVTMLPIKQLGVDAAILFSDILVIVEALGMKLHFDDGAGPRIERPLSEGKDLDNLPTPDIENSLSYVKQAIQGLVPNLKVPLIGFCGAPFTIASYMIEGKSSRDLRKTKKWMLHDPKSFHKLLQHIAKHSIAYLELQIKAGVHAIQIFDSWANFLAHQQFREFSLAYLQTIVDGLREKNIPIILFCKGSSVFASQLAELRPAAISLDWNCDLPTLQHQLSPTIALQGNLDPDILYAPPHVIKKEVTTLLDGMKGNPGYIFNLGHGILPDIPFENVRTLVETVQSR